ncbi:MAG TPA: MarR family transcriptional regulator [Mycobacterium sp.]|nr:MarR family transcriptional regulator [Mycobacterium sp.]
MPATSEAADQPLGYLLYRVGAVLQPAVTAALRPLGLTLPELVCMKVLSAWPGMSNAELARANNVSPQAMNNVLLHLQEMDVVTRPASVSSGRALPAQLTRQGKALLKRAEAAVEGAEEQVLTDLTSAQRRELKRLLGTIGAAAPTPLELAADGRRAARRR